MLSFHVLFTELSVASFILYTPKFLVGERKERNSFDEEIFHIMEVRAPILLHIYFPCLPTWVLKIHLHIHIMDPICRETDTRRRKETARPLYCSAHTTNLPPFPWHFPISKKIAFRKAQQFYRMFCRVQNSILKTNFLVKITSYESYINVNLRGKCISVEWYYLYDIRALRFYWLWDMD